MERIRRKILVVDDSKSSRQYLRAALEKEGHEVQTCGDAAEACWDIIDNQPDFIISDWQMPCMDGAELCQWVRSQHCLRYIYFIIMTAHRQEFNLVDGLDAGADEYLQKPIRIHELVTRLRCGERILQLRDEAKMTEHGGAARL